MRIKNLELWLALTAMLLITALYLAVVLSSEIPSASSFFGHSLGIAGFLLMLMTETLYSIRKRSKTARWGRLQNWLAFHIFTGLVGPYLVLLHSSWKFNGLAGILTLFTLIIVISGFVGRYFYTALPRSAEGILLEYDQASAKLQTLEAQFAALLAPHPELADQLPDGLSSSRQAAGKSRPSTRYWKELERRVPPEDHGLLAQVRSNWEMQGQLEKQLESLASSRRLLAAWHAFHIPLGVATFLIGLVHIAAALYYATFLH